MKNAKPVSIPLAGHMKLIKKMCPTAREEKENMAKVLFLRRRKSNVCNGVH